MADAQPYSAASTEGQCAAGAGAEDSMYVHRRGHRVILTPEEDHAVCICTEGECAFCGGQGKQLCGSPLFNRMCSSGCVSRMEV